MQGTSSSFLSQKDEAQHPRLSQRCWSHCRSWQRASFLFTKQNTSKLDLGVKSWSQSGQWQNLCFFLSGSVSALVSSVRLLNTAGTQN